LDDGWGEAGCNGELRGVGNVLVGGHGVDAAECPAAVVQDHTGGILALGKVALWGEGEDGGLLHHAAVVLHFAGEDESVAVGFWLFEP